MSSSIEKPEVSDRAMSLFKYLFYNQIWFLEEQHGAMTTFAQQMKIKRLQGLMKKFIYNRAYSFFNIIILPTNGTDPNNAEISLSIKNFDYFIEGLEPKRYKLIISPTWDIFSAYEETVDKNLIKLEL